MHKGTKILISAVCGVAAVMVLVIAALWLPPVQRFAVQRTAGWLGKKLDATIGFDNVRVRPVGVISFKGLYAIDNQGDTLLYANLDARIGWERNISVRRVTVSDGKADIKRIISRLGGGGGEFTIEAAEMREMCLQYDTLTLGNVALKARNFKAKGKDISLKLKELSFLYLHEKVAISAPSIKAVAGALNIDGAHLSTTASNLQFERLYFDFATKTLDATLQNSTLSLPKLTINELNADISGTIDDITAKLNCTAGTATRLVGSGRWQRKSEIFTLKVDTLETTAVDIEEIAPLFTEKPLPDSLAHILRRLQPIAIKGDFGGNEGAITARATISTALGAANTDLTLSADKTVEGEVELHDLDLGRLFSVEGLGRTTAIATITGTTADIEIARINYKGYDYQHITTNSRFEDNLFTAHLHSYDPNIVFTLDLKSVFEQEPDYNFALSLTHANLRALNINSRDKISRLSLTANGTIGKNTSATISNILYINDSDTIRTKNIALVATPEYQKITSDLTLAAAFIPGLDTSGNSILTATRKDNLTIFHAEADSLRKGDTAIAGVRIDGEAQTDTISFTGNFSIGKQKWNIGAREIVPKSKQLKISGLTLEGAGQRLYVNGTASRNRQDTLAISAENFDLTPLSDILRTGHNISGRANGRALLTAALDHPALTAAIKLDKLQIDHVVIPTLDFRSSWQDGSVRLLLIQHGLSTPLFTAGYSPATRRLEGRIDIRNIDLSLLDTHYKRTLSATKGRADFNAAINGTPGRGGLKINGDILVNDYSAKVDFLGVRYATVPDTRLKIEDNIIIADSISMLDPENNIATMTAAIDLRRLKNVAYKFDISSPNILALDTSHDDSPQFYGHVYASATASLEGSKQGTNLSVTASTQPGSSFFMPLNDKLDIGNTEFLTFSGQPLPAATRRRGRLSSDITLTVEPNTTVELLIDPKTGHRLQGQGNGLLNLHVSPRNGEFTIYGDYRIDEGTYFFTLENIIERPFTITPGSTIQWMGDPLDARLDIAATYRLKTSVSPAVAGTGYDSWRMRIPVECHINLTERLSAPVLAFDITAPNATPETQSILHSFLDTPEMTATQFFFLVATGNFYDYEGGAGDIGAAAGTTTAFDFLSNQIMGLIPTRNTNIGIHYRPQTETTSDEWGVGFTQQLWGERLLLEIEGNYDTRNNQSAAYTENMRNFTGDFYLTGIIDRRGTLRAKAFTRTITRFDENQGLQESGAGIYFTEDFNTFGDIFRRWKRSKRVPASGKTGVSSETKETDN